MGKYKPWKGFGLIGAAVVLDFLTGRTGLHTAAVMVAVLFWTAA